MKAGHRMCIMINKIAPDFKNQFNDPKMFPTDLIFNYNEFCKIENYKSIILPEEDYDFQGNKGCYIIDKEYALVILSSA